MNSTNPDSNCVNARLYYYDFLNEETKRDIPGSALEHTAQCRHCQDDIGRLKALLADTDIEQSRQNSAIITILGFHFAYIGKSVSCSTVKPFLPGLTVPALEISIPTPITTHFDNCRACSKDLLTLKNLGLTQIQLYRLGQLFAEKLPGDTVSCLQAQAAIPSVVAMVFRETNAEVLKHLCTCPDCRKRLFEHRETTRTELLNSGRAQKEFPCEKASATDIFDYCFPYGIDPANDQYAKLKEPLTSHLRNCPTCLAKMQQLHNTVYGIAERPDSGIVTCYEIDPPVEKAEISDGDNLYADWPIEVQVLNKSRPAPDILAFPRRLKQRVSAINIKQFIKLAAVAAAILIAVALFFNAPDVKAMNLRQIYEALEKVKNVCISRFIPGNTQPIQKVWVSRTNGFRLRHTGKTFVLWDFANNTKKVRTLENNTVQVTTLSGDTITEGKKALKSSFGLVPFPDITDVPEGSQWKRVDDKDIEVIGDGLEVYDLAWSETKGTITEYYKWRGFIYIETNLPKRIECYKKQAIDDKYTLESITAVEYPPDSAIDAIIRSIFD